MTEDERGALMEAHQAWRDAEDAYHEEAAKYVAVWWASDAPGPEVPGPQPLTKAALKKLDELTADKVAKRDAYHAMAQSLGLT